jgi:hypothetical protein
MLRYLLDTNICIDVIKRRPQDLLDTFNRHGAQMAISATAVWRSFPTAPEPPSTTDRSGPIWKAKEPPLG